jgi:hypothetical protein
MVLANGRTQRIVKGAPPVRLLHGVRLLQRSRQRVLGEGKPEHRLDEVMNEGRGVDTGEGLARRACTMGGGERYTPLGAASV